MSRLNRSRDKHVIQLRQTSFLPEISDRKPIIIFGCGKNGRLLFKYLKRAGMGGDICCFADNNHRVNFYKRKKIVRPEDAKKLYENALWIISSSRNSLQMRQQLQEMQIDVVDILQITTKDIHIMERSIHKYWYQEDKNFIYGYGFPINFEFIITQIRNIFWGKYYEYVMKKDAIGKMDSQYKYNVSICAIFLNEAPYMREWIEFHRMVGVEHFYMYNNMSTDDYASILNSYVEEGIVTLIDWNIPQGQISAYWDCVKRFSDETRWIGFIDLDEFVFPRENKIYDFLKKYNSCGAVLIYRKTFGSSGKNSRDLNGLVLEDFKKCWPKLDEFGKCFYNTSYPLSSERKNGRTLHHVCWTRRKDKDCPPINVYGKVSVLGSVQRTSKKLAPMQINHYAVKSYKEYQKKIMQPDSVFEKNPRTEESFYGFDRKAVAEDNSIDMYLPELKRRLDK